MREGALALGLIVTPPEQAEQEVQKPVGQEQVEERGSGWWGGLKNSLRPQFTTAPVGRKERGVLPPGTYKIGEVRADYVKVSAMCGKGARVGQKLIVERVGAVSASIARHRYPQFQGLVSESSSRLLIT